MPFEEKPRPVQRPHSLTLDERSRLSISGVEEVVSFDETEVAVRTVKGLLSVRGSGLKVDRLDKGAGELALSGSVSELDYQEPRGETGFWARLFGG